MREQLARDQEAVVKALTGAGGPPDGFDPRQLQLTARTLISKRRAGVAKLWLGVVQSLGDHFERLFDQYASAIPVPEAGALDDGRTFAEHLLKQRKLPDQGRMELVSRRAGRGWPIRMIRLADSSRLVIAIRIRWVHLLRLAFFRQPNRPLDA